MRVEDKPLFWCDLDDRDKTIDRLRAEVEALRADAGRYRYLRRGQHWSIINGIGDELRAETLDAAIDAAIAKAEAGNAQ